MVRRIDVDAHSGDGVHTEPEGHNPQHDRVYRGVGVVDKQVNLAKATIRTKKGKLVDHKGAATHVLNAMGGVQWGAAPRGGSISGVGRVAIWQEEDSTDLNPENDGGISAKDRQLQRKRISLQLSRGQKLSTKLIKDLGLGILFSPKIW